MRTPLRAVEGPLTADAEAPSGSGFIALLETFRMTGGTAPGEIMGALLEEHHAGDAVGLARLLCSGELFAFEWRASLWLPMFQFALPDLSLKVAPQRVRLALPTAWSGWALACWFATPNAWLTDRRPVDLLDTDPDAVLRAAQSLKWIDEFAPLWAPRSIDISPRV
jgi:hypothetical protein